MKRLAKAPATATREQVWDRSRGALVGLAVGEALGAPFKGRQIPAPDFPRLCDAELDIRGGGPLELRRGQPSWGTQLAVVLAGTLQEYRRYDLFEAARAYARWAATAKEVPEPVKQAAALIAEGRPVEWVGRRVWLENHQQVVDNGPLARTAPLAVFYPTQQQERLRATLDDTALTHFAPQCRLACATFNGILAAAISTPKDRLQPEELLKVAEAELSLAASTLGRAEPDWVQQVKDAADWLRDDLRAAQAPDPMLYGPELHLFHRPSYVRVAYRLALWELFHAPSFEAGLTDVVSRGGDADLNAAIAGALLGGVYGEHVVPERWREPVLEYVPAGDDPCAAWHAAAMLTLVGAGPADGGR